MLAFNVQRIQLQRSCWAAAGERAFAVALLSDRPSLVIEVRLTIREVARQGNAQEVKLMTTRQEWDEYLRYVQGYKSLSPLHEEKSSDPPSKEVATPYDPK